MWSVDPVIVRDAAEIGAALAAARPRPVTVPLSVRPPTDEVANLRRATTITNRIVAELDA